MATQEKLRDDQQGPTSAYERILANDITRGAFFGTTRGLLRGRQDDPEYIATVEELSSMSFPVVTSTPDSEPRPVLLANQQKATGYDEIVALASQAREQ